MDDFNSRKRPRSVSPTPPASSKARTSGVPSADEFALRLADPSLRNGALNDLLKITANHEVSFPLEDDNMANALAQVFLETIGWDQITHESAARLEAPAFSSKAAWRGYVTPSAKSWAKYCKEKLSKDRLGPDELRTIEAVLVVIRNLSFLAANLRLLAYSPMVLQILVGGLHENATNTKALAGDDTSASTSSNSIALSALHALVNLAPYLDVTGQKLLADKLFLQASGGTLQEDLPMIPNPLSFGQAADGSWGFGSLWLAKRLDTKEDVVADVSKGLLLKMTQDFLVHIWSIFPGLAERLEDSKSPRLVIMMAVEFLQEFINHARVAVVGTAEQEEESDDDVPSARSIMVNLPDPCLKRLMDLLYVPRLDSDGLNYVDPVKNIVTRVTTLKLMMGYDATIDTDVRDRSLDVLVLLLELDSPRLAKKLGVDDHGKPRNRLFDAILPILATRTGRNEAPLLASQLLKELSKAEENRVGCLFLQGRIIELASKDSRVAHLAFNHMFPSEKGADQDVV